MGQPARFPILQQNRRADVFDAKADRLSTNVDGKLSGFGVWQASLRPGTAGSFCGQALGCLRYVSRKKNPLYNSSVHISPFTPGTIQMGRHNETHRPNHDSMPRLPAETGFNAELIQGRCFVASLYPGNEQRSKN